jgi:hypothetical protein
MGLLIDRTAESFEHAFERAAQIALADQLREIERILADASPVPGTTKASPGPDPAPGINWQSISQDTSAYLLTDGQDAWRRAFRPVLRGVMSAQGEAWSNVFGFSFNTRNFHAEQWYRDYELQFSQAVSQTTSQGISRLLLQAMQEGWSMPKTRQRLRKVFRQWMYGGERDEDFTWLADRLPAHRAMLIARTETMRASNAGSHALFDQMGAGQKEWLATSDHRTRDTHRHANGQVRPMAAPFRVGASLMMHPGDMSLGAPVREVANCRCTVLPVLDDDATVQDDALPPGDDPEALQAQQDAAIDDAIAEVHRLPHERMIVLDRAGNRLLTKDGTNDAVAITETEMNRLRGIGATMIHNHPSGWGFPVSHPQRGGNSFSRSDIETAADLQLANTIVVSPGYLYEMRPPESGWDISWWHKFGLPTYMNIGSELEIEMRRQVREREITPQQANARHYHEVWLRWYRLTRALYERNVYDAANTGLGA